MEYSTWEASLPRAITADQLWQTRVYRLALFAADVSWKDLTPLLRDPRTRSLADQLCRSVGSISANIAEGYSRGTPSDRRRFYEYALGSARESRDWYYKARYVLGDGIAGQRLEVLTEVARLLLATIRHQQGKLIRRF
jgi:four helix bundle protein